MAMFSRSKLVGLAVDSQEQAAHLAEANRDDDFRRRIFRSLAEGSDEVGTDHFGQLTDSYTVRISGSELREMARFQYKHWGLPVPDFAKTGALEAYRVSAEGMLSFGVGVIEGLKEGPEGTVKTVKFVGGTAKLGFEIGSWLVTGRVQDKAFVQKMDKEFGAAAKGMLELGGSMREQLWEVIRAFRTNDTGKLRGKLRDVADLTIEVAKSLPDH